jgi:hypothetical protein
MADLDPVTMLQQVDVPVVLQFATSDPFVTDEVTARMSAAAGAEAEITTFTAGHDLDADAAVDRDAWLLAALGE